MAVKTEAEKQPDLVALEVPFGSETEPDFIWVGYNGKGYQIKRGETVMVPAGVAALVKDSLEAERAQKRWKQKQTVKNTQ